MFVDVFAKKSDQLQYCWIDDAREVTCTRQGQTLKTTLPFVGASGTLSSELAERQATDLHHHTLVKMQP